MALQDLSKFIFGLPSYRFNMTSEIFLLLHNLGINTQNGRLLWLSSSDVGICRSLIVSRFLFSPECLESEVLVMSDGDTVATKEQVEQLVSLCRPEMPVIGSNMVYRGMPDNNNWFFADDEKSLKKDEILNDFQRANSLIQVDYCGFGLIALHRSALETMAERYGIYYMGGRKCPDLFSCIKHKQVIEGEPEVEGVLLPETFSFCQRAKESNIPVMVHLGVRPGHTDTNNLRAQKPFCKPNLSLPDEPLLLNGDSHYSSSLKEQLATT